MSNYFLLESHPQGRLFINASIIHTSSLSESEQRVLRLHQKSIDINKYKQGKTYFQAFAKSSTCFQDHLSLLNAFRQESDFSQILIYNSLQYYKEIKNIIFSKDLGVVKCVDFRGEIFTEEILLLKLHAERMKKGDPSENYVSKAENREVRKKGLARGNVEGRKIKVKSLNISFREKYKETIKRVLAQDEQKQKLISNIGKESRYIKMKETIDREGEDGGKMKKIGETGEKVRKRIQKTIEKEPGKQKITILRGSSMLMGNNQRKRRNKHLSRVNQLKEKLMSVFGWVKKIILGWYDGKWKVK